MAKVTHLELATLVSKRIIELIDLTELTLEGLATFAGLSTSTVRGAYKMTGSMSLESLSKICTPLHISLTDFFNPSLPLCVELKKLPVLLEFKQLYFEKDDKKRMVAHPLKDKNQPINHRHQRELIIHIIYSTTYFDTAKTIEQMMVDFEKDYATVFTAERLYGLLQKHVGNEILEKKSIPRALRSSPFGKRPHLYLKK